VLTGPVATLNGMTDLTHPAFLDDLELSFGALAAKLFSDSSELASACKGLPLFRESGKHWALLFLIYLISNQLLIRCLQ
jgi:hypothetical protein